ncbi:MAG TPA: polysaccharide deacetylase family protein [Clostridia bacterium]|nr:polysaccharide deacetylase family protein [Clostridia bacterium]
MIIVIKKYRLIIAAILIVALVAGVIAAVYCARPAEEAGARPSKLLPVYCVDTTDSVAALTFDAAWGSDKTQKILDILDEYDVKATFFLVGFWVDKNPELVKEIQQRGHLVGNHSNTHPHFNSLNAEKTSIEIDAVNKKIKDLTGGDVTYFRAPFGEYNNTLISTLGDMNMKCIQWDVDSLDWKGISSGQITENVLGKVKKGSIILFHNNSDHILEALPLVLIGLKNKGLKGVRLDALVLEKDYYIDNNGVQRAK